MPQQDTRDEVKETGIVGIGFTLIALSVQTFDGEPVVGLLGIVVGFALVFFGIRFRNINVGLSGEEVMDGIREAQDAGEDVVDDLLGDG